MKEYERKEVIWCHWDLIRFLKEKDLTDEKVIGVSEYRKTKDGKKAVLDYKIYMKKENGKFKADIFTDKENKDEFEFNNFDDLQEFVDNLAWKHPEYIERPMEVVVLED